MVLILNSLVRHKDSNRDNYQNIGGTSVAKMNHLGPMVRGFKKGDG